MRALIVTNMYPTPERPAFGSFVRDQTMALRRLPGIDVELFSFSSGARGPAAYPAAASALRRRFGGETFDVVHAHFGLSVWPALAARAAVRLVTLHGTDLAHPRSRLITLAGLRRVDVVAAVSEPLAALVPVSARRGRAVAVLPCGVDLERFVPIDRGSARARLGLRADGRYVLFPADPARPEKRIDRAREVIGDAELLTLGAVDPALVPLWVNAANAVVVPSERESFGLAVLEALACNVPVLATPQGIAPDALAGIEGALCAEFDADRWRAALAPSLAAPDPRVSGRSVAEQWSADRMAVRVAEKWQEALSERRSAAGPDRILGLSA
jgi:glycosyltransferase involved in cell wall biosynthesis